MLRGVVAGILKGAVSVFLVINAIFLIFQVIPGDPARVIAGEGASEEQLAKIRRELGLDVPLHQRYLNTIFSLITFDFGKSMYRQVKVSSLLVHRLMNSLKLAFVTIVLVIVESIILFLLYLKFRGLESVIVALTTFIYSIPNFWLGIMLIVVFSVKLKFLPMSGYEGPKSLVLPAVTLSISLSVVLSRFMRNSAEQVIRTDFFRFLKAKGVYGIRLYIHVLRAILPTIITVMGLQIGVLLSGVVVTENVFSFPGVGSLIVESVLARDFPVIIAAVFVISSLWVAVNLVVDVLVKVVDPRLR